MNASRKLGLASAGKLALAVLALSFLACSGLPDSSERSADSGGFHDETTRHEGQPQTPEHRHKRHSDRRNPTKLPKGVPDKVARVLEHIDKYGRAPKGYVGGRTFGNRERRLPRRDQAGKPIRYQEWDVNPKIRGKNRGAERLVTGSDGTAYYTPDHYKTFIKIR